MTKAIVVGQGAAGLSATLALAKEGLDVVSISKVRPGNATCTIYAGGGFTLPVDGMPSEEHRKMTYDVGRHLNDPELLSVFSSEAPSIVPFLESAGVPFRSRRGGLSLQRDMGFPLLGGKPLTDHLHEASLEKGVTFLHNLAAMRLLMGDKGVSGVECIDHASGVVVTLEADVIILATGGGGALYERTDNPQRITGDGYRLALDAGCHIVDMEFVQFYPMGFDLPGGAHWFVDLGIIDHARAISSDGREFLRDMLAKEGITSGREANLLARDKCSVAIALENEKGQCYLHTEDISEDVWRERYAAVARMFPSNSPPWKNPVPLYPIEHYFPGGIVIGIEGQTEIPGLFACGEVTGGVDGANRVGGNALTNCVLFGMRSAKAAARHARGDSVAPIGLEWLPPSLTRRGQVEARAVDGEHPHEGIESASNSNTAKETTIVSTIESLERRSAQEWLDTWKNGAAASPISPTALRDSFKSFSTRYLLPLRRGHLLEQAQDEILRLKSLLEKQQVKDSHDLLLAAENLGLWYTASAVSRGALLREESRGAHYRADFPTESPSWQKHIYLTLNA